MSSALPEEVSNIAVEYNFRWTDASFQQDIASLMRLIRSRINKELKFKQGYIAHQVCLLFCDSPISLPLEAQHRQEDVGYDKGGSCKVGRSC